LWFEKNQRSDLGSITDEEILCHYLSTKDHRKELTEQSWVHILIDMKKYTHHRESWGINLSWSIGFCYVLLGTV
jgi:hypothetical protein